MSSFFFKARESFSTEQVWWSFDKKWILIKFDSFMDRWDCFWRFSVSASPLCSGGFWRPSDVSARRLLVPGCSFIGWNQRNQSNPSRFTDGLYQTEQISDLPAWHCGRVLISSLHQHQQQQQHHHHNHRCHRLQRHLRGRSCSLPLLLSSCTRLLCMSPPPLLDTSALPVKTDFHDVTNTNEHETTDGVASSCTNWSDVFQPLLLTASFWDWQKHFVEPWGRTQWWWSASASSISSQQRASEPSCTS